MSEIARLLAAALAYAAAGIHVFPVRVAITAGGAKKVGPIARWREASTTSADTIRGWWASGSEWADASIAIDCGKSGLVVVDPDGEDGLTAWGKLVAEHDLPATWRAATPGGGEHWYYAENPRRVVGIDSSGKVADHVDVRGLGGFVIAPPSADSRGAYRWLEGAPGWPELPTVPDLVTDRMNPRNDQRKQPEGAAEPRSGAPGGDGDPFDDSERRFTRDQAEAFVRPHFDALRNAPVGTINNQLNDAAVVLGHFVPAFWPRADAERWLTKALGHTAYDGATWKAGATIASGLDAPGWRAVLVEHSEGDAPLAGLDPLAREVARLHLVADAREIFAAERHARGWTPPVSHGPLTDELALPDDLPRWRLKNLLGVGHNAVLVAPRKAGKTTMVDNLVSAYVDGGPFLGRFEVTPADAAVAIFNYEVEETQYRRWLRESGIVNTDRVHVLHLRGQPLPLKDAQVRGWVTRWLRDRGVGLWIVDPYSRAYVGSLDNGNDEAQVGSFLDTLDVIKAEAGASELVMPVHTPKAKVEAGEESAIGSQRLEGWPDSMWYLVRDFETGLRFLRAEGRDVDVGEEQLTYDPFTRGLTLGGWDRAGMRRKADVETLMGYLRANPGATQNDIRSGLEWGADRVKKAVGQAGQGVRSEEKKGARLHYAVG